jgi:hypothetical protein
MTRAHTGHNSNWHRRRGASAYLCRIIVPALWFTLACAMSLGQSNENELHQLRINGVVSSLQRVDGEHAVSVYADLTLTAKNVGQGNLILLRARPWSDAENLYASPGKPRVYNLSHGRSVERGRKDRKWENLQAALDQPIRPDDLTIVLKPGESIQWQSSISLQIPLKASAQYAGGDRPDRESWDVVKKACPCWLTLDVDLWPLNLEPGTSEAFPLGKRLSKQWAHEGTLLIGTRETELIKIDLEAMSPH